MLLLRKTTGYLGVRWTLRAEEKIIGKAFRYCIFCLLIGLFVATTAGAAGSYENVHVDRASLSEDNSRVVFGTDIGVFIYDTDRDIFQKRTGSRFGSPAFLDANRSVLFVGTDGPRGDLYSGYSLRVAEEGESRILFNTGAQADSPIFLPSHQKFVYSKINGPADESEYGLYSHSLYINGIQGDSERLLWRAPYSYVKSASFDNATSKLFISTFSMHYGNYKFLTLDLESGEIESFPAIDLAVGTELPFRRRSSFGDVTYGIDKEGQNVLALEVITPPRVEQTYLVLTLVDREGKKTQLSKFAFSKEISSGFTLLRAVSGSARQRVFVFEVEKVTGRYDTDTSRIYILNLDKKTLIRLVLHRESDALTGLGVSVKFEEE